MAWLRLVLAVIVVGVVQGHLDQVSDVTIDPLEILRSNRYSRSLELHDAPFEFKINSESGSFKFNLQPRFDLFTENAKFLAKDDNSHVNIDVNQHQRYKGTVNDDPASYVTMRVSLDGTLSGAFVFQDEEYNIRPAAKTSRSLDGNEHVLYKAVTDDISQSHFLDSLIHADAYLDPPKETEETYSRRAAYVDGKDTCDLALIADNKFFTEVGNSDYAFTVDQMLERFTTAKDIFESTTFSKPVKLKVSYLEVLTTSASDIYKDHSGAGDWFLGNFSKTDWEDHCLAHIVTNFDFPNGLLGLAWVGSADNTAGGICQDSTGSGANTLYTNTGFSTSQNFGNQITTLMAGLVMSHEMGHNFGSSHDTTAQTEASGNYLMWPVAVDGTKSNNNKFSPYSIDLINAVIEAKGGCFDTLSGADCGNSVVEVGEECDCGTGTCADIDACCNSFGSADQCTLISSADCSPNNPQNGTCCTSSCDFKAVSTLCRPAEECKAESYCEAEGHCPLSEDLQDNTVCNENTTLCHSGTCSKSVCSLWGLEEADIFQNCELHCNDSGIAKGLDELGAPVGTAYDSEGSTYTFTGPLTKAPGAPCMFIQDEPGSGQCDDQGVCVEVEVENLLDQIADLLNDLLNQALNWLTQTDYFIPNWAWITIGVVVLIIIIIIVCACSNASDRRQAEKKQAQRRRGKVCQFYISNIDFW